MKGDAVEWIIKTIEFIVTIEKHFKTKACLLAKETYDMYKWKKWDHIYSPEEATDDYEDYSFLGDRCLKLIEEAEDDDEAAPESELEALVLGLFTEMGGEERASITIKQLMAKMKDKTGEDYAERKGAIKAAWIKVFQEN